MSWFKKLLPSRIQTESPSKKGVPEGLWSKCDACGSVLYRADLEANHWVCTKCTHHHRLSARQRLALFLDPDSSIEFADTVDAVDWLKFRDTKKYSERLALAQKSTGEREALIACEGLLNKHPLVAVAFEFAFMGGSMGTALGERFVQAVDRSIYKRIPLVCFSASGGARMQEGLFSLMQMSKTSAALAKLAQEQIPYISVLTDPTMGGVSASLAMLGDLIIAEPNALIGFAGPRVIEQTVRQTLPEGFQRSEFLLTHGAIDMICDRRQLRTRLSELLQKLFPSTI